MRQTHSASAKVMSEPMSVATQADQRSTASMKSKAATGTSATSQVMNILPVGLRIWLNMVATLADQSSAQLSRYCMQRYHDPVREDFSLCPSLDQVWIQDLRSRQKKA